MTPNSLQNHFRQNGRIQFPTTPVRYMSAQEEKAQFTDSFREMEALDGGPTDQLPDLDRVYATHRDDTGKIGGLREHSEISEWWGDEENGGIRNRRTFPQPNGGDSALLEDVQTLTEGDKVIQLTTMQQEGQSDFYVMYTESSSQGGVRVFETESFLGGDWNIAI